MANTTHAGSETDSHGPAGTSNYGMNSAVAALLGAAVTLIVVGIACFLAVQLSGGIHVAQPAAGATVEKAEAGAAEPVMAAATTSAPSEVTPEQIAKGQVAYERSCVTCHAADGTGVANMGNNLVTSAFVKQSDVATIGALIKKGRAADDPANMMKKPMPAKGTNPSMTDRQVEYVAAYVKSLAK